jgi:catechol 2,3-dioxygenase-like lactoylglutathione lyase family enzyme
VDMRLEVVVLPVRDVDRAKAFYRSLGFREDIDYASGEDFRVVQFTPPASGTSIVFGKGIIATPPGSRATGDPIRRSPRTCSSARGPSSGTCEKSSQSSE